MNELCNYRFVRAGEVHHAREIIKEDIIHERLCLSVYEDSLPVPATYNIIYFQFSCRKNMIYYIWYIMRNSYGSKNRKMYERIKIATALLALCIPTDTI